MIDLSIRKATPSDIPTLIRFQQSLAIETEGVNLDRETLESGMRAMFADPSKGVYYVAVSGIDIVGCHMVTYEWSDWRNGMVYWLQSVYVKQDFRKHGVFRMMFSNLLMEVKNNPQIAGLRLYVDKSNQRAQEVYKAMGMNGDHYTVYELMKE
jgi:ribosomal protein S18 acetylase RimI-like enzyme